MTTRRHTVAGLLAASLAAVVCLQAPARADVERCTNGDAQTILNAGPTVQSVVWLPGRGLTGNAVDAVSQCRYSVWQDDAHVTFTSTDVFVGQVAWLFPWKAAGMPRHEAIADLELIHDRVWLASVGPGGEVGALVEQELQYSAFKDTQSRGLGQIVYQQRGFKAQFPPGEYVSVWLNQFPGERDSTATVWITVTG